jgi:hypothetical protein
MKAKGYPTQETLQTMFEYKDGQLYSKCRKSKKFGKPVGHFHEAMQRVVLKIGTRTLQYARVVYIMAHGDLPSDMIVDHIDRNQLNNDLSNLRLVTKSDNNRNRKTLAVSGRRGVYWKKDHNAYYTCSTDKNGKRVFLGYFQDKEKAYQTVTNFLKTEHTHLEGLI